MGVHHFTMELVPRGYFTENPLPSHLTAQEIDQGHDLKCGWWASQPPSEQLLATLRKFLPTDKSWGEIEEYLSGDDWGSDIRIWRDNGQVFSIVFRFSPVVDKWLVLQRFITVAREAQCLLLQIETGEVFEPVEDVACDKLAKSRAMQFVQDPQKTIVRAAEKASDEPD